MARTGPDEALWAADIFRAVIEHPEWDPRRDAEERSDHREGHDCGRIYRAARGGVPVPAARDPAVIVLDGELVAAARLAEWKPSAISSIRPLVRRRPTPPWRRPWKP